MSSIFNKDIFNQAFMKFVNEEIEKEMQPIIEKAVDDLRVKLKQKLAVAVISAIEFEYDISKMGGVINIRVKQF